MAESPRLALRVVGLKVVKQLLVVQVSQPRAIVRYPVGISKDEEVLHMVKVHMKLYTALTELAAISWLAASGAHQLDVASGSLGDLLAHNHLQSESKEK